MSDFKIPDRKQSFVINSEHADMIVNDLLQGEYEALGKLFEDLVNFNLYGDETIVERECTDRAERSARRLLRSDSDHYIRNWLARSEQNAKNRTSGQQPSREEVIDYATVKGYDQQAVIGWALDMARNDWKDKNGEPIKYWKKALDAYIRGIQRNKLEDMAKSIGKK